MDRSLDIVLFIRLNPLHHRPHHIILTISLQGFCRYALAQSLHSLRNYVKEQRLWNFSLKMRERGWIRVNPFSVSLCSSFCSTVVDCSAGLFTSWSGRDYALKIRRTL